MLLSEIVKNTEYFCNAFGDREISDICYDSRKVSSGSIFVCLVGTFADGHEYIGAAYGNGCRVFAVEKIPAEDYPDAVFLKFRNTRKALALMSAAFYGYPAKKLSVIGITGTKGKTSISFMLKSIFEEAGKKVGVIGTTGTFYGDFFEKSDNSTPESLEIHRHFKGMSDAGVDICVMEVSSQGLMMHRTYGIEFDAGIYTNLSTDHIGAGEHSSFEEYRDCKAMLFAQCKSAFANADDANCDYVTAPFDGKVLKYSVDEASDFKAENIRYESDENGLHTYYEICAHKNRFPVSLNIPGKFSVYNSLSAASCALHFGATTEHVQKGLAKAEVVGRMQKVDVPLPYTVIIDYAHNELSMENLYSTINCYPHKRIVTLFGCGGNRSRMRRYDLGYIASKNSELCVITSDNPRFEKLEDINEDIRVGLDKGLLENPSGSYVEINDRKAAIHYCLDWGKPGDVILITGKGHQHYDEVAGKKIPFFEEEIIKEYAAQKLAGKENNNA